MNSENVRAMQCQRIKCGAQVTQAESAPCPDCGGQMEWMLGECEDCFAPTSSPEEEICRSCAAYYDHIDRQIDAEKLGEDF